MKKKTRIVFLGSRPLGKKVLAFLRAQSDVDLLGMCVLPDGAARYWTEDPSDFDDIARLDIRDLYGMQFDLGVSINYWEKIEGTLLQQPTFGFINVHHSYNLRLRGRNSTSYAILQARRENIWHHGSTLHFMASEIDAGNIIASHTCPITEYDTAESLFKRAEATSIAMLEEWLPRIWRENILAYPPPAEFRSFKFLDLSKEKEVDMHMPAIDIYDRVRAFIFPPFEEPYAMVDGKKRHLTIAKEHGADVAAAAAPDKVVYWKKNG